MIDYQLILAEPFAHRLHVRCTVPAPRQEGEQFRIPSWIPGSYLIREFSRHVVDAYAEQDGQRVLLEKADKQTWRTGVLSSQSPLVLTLVVHAWDLSVRGAHFDQFHAFVNGCAVFPEVLGRSEEACRLTIDPMVSVLGESWTVYSSLPNLLADNYAALIDHPLEIGLPERYEVLAFDVAGVPHRMIIRGAGRFAKTRLQNDLQKICATVIAFFGGQAPFENYDFLVTLTGDGYGGLEHRNCTALLASRDDLPPVALADDQPPGEAYARYLELCAHEYFHAWLVKRICDQSFVTSSLQAEAYSPLLWFFEGFTSYYDALMLVRAGIIDHNRYVSLLEKTITQVNSVPGQSRQSLAESSFDAWIKYYRPDDNTPNSVVSYYAKGSLLALALDICLRRQGSSADAWLQAIWKDFACAGIEVTEERLFDHLQTFAGEDVASQLRRWVTERGSLPMENLLAEMGIALKWDKPAGVLAWGLRVSEDKGMVKVTHVLDDSIAQAAGLAAGDLLVAIDHLRVTPANLEARLQRVPQAESVSFVIFREDVLQSLLLTCHRDDSRYQQALLTLLDTSSICVERRAAWLKGS